jgi:hypothetical protein
MGRLIAEAEDQMTVSHRVELGEAPSEGKFELCKHL